MIKKRPISTFFTVFCLFLGIISIAGCSKEMPPIVQITVQELDETPCPLATVVISVGDPQNPDGNGSGIINEEDFEKTGITDNSGVVEFEFPHSAVLTASVTYEKIVGTTKVTLTGARIIKLSSMHQKAENISEEIIFVN